MNNLFKQVIKVNYVFLSEYYMCKVEQGDMTKIVALKQAEESLEKYGAKLIELTTKTAICQITMWITLVFLYEKFAINKTALFTWHSILLVTCQWDQF